MSRRWAILCLRGPRWARRAGNTLARTRWTIRKRRWTCRYSWPIPCAGSRAIPSDWAFVLAFSFFRLAAIAQGVAKRAEQGNASSEQAVQAGRMTEMLAKLGLEVLG